MAPRKEPEFSESDKAALDHARGELEDHKYRARLRADLGKVAKWFMIVVTGLAATVDAALRLWGYLQ